MNFIYRRGRHELMVGTVDWAKDDIRALLYDIGHYTPDPSHKSLRAIPKQARVLETKVTGRRLVYTTEWAADADDLSFPNPGEQRSVEGIVIYKHNGPLIAHIDGGGFPMLVGEKELTTNVKWSDGDSRIFAAGFVYQAAHCITMEELRPTVDELYRLSTKSGRRDEIKIARLIEQLHKRVHVKPPELA